MFTHRPDPVESKRHRHRGSALIAVFWAIAILSLAVFTTSQFLLFEVESTSSERDQFRAEQLAEMAIAIAANPDTEKRDPILSQRISANESFRGAIRTEGAALNLNTFLNETDRGVLENLFFIWGIPLDQAAQVVDALIDWVDEDNNVSGPGGAEYQIYQQAGFEDQPYNRPFRDLDEVTLVAGIDLLASVRPDWRRSFSLWSSGALNLNEAPVDLIQAVCNCSRQTARQFVQTRNGNDGILDTEDDRQQFETVEEALSLMGLSSDDVVANHVGINDSVTRLIGIGSVGRVSVERVVVIRNRGDRPTLLDFSTRRLQ